MFWKNSLTTLENEDFDGWIFTTPSSGSQVNQQLIAPKV